MKDAVQVTSRGVNSVEKLEAWFLNLIGLAKANKTPVSALVAILGAAVRERILIPLERNEKRALVGEPKEREANATGTKYGWFKGELHQHIWEIVSQLVERTGEAKLFVSETQKTNVMRELRATMSVASGLVEKELGIGKNPANATATAGKPVKIPRNGNAHDNAKRLLDSFGAAYVATLAAELADLTKSTISKAA